MAYGVIKVSQTSALAQPSDAIWADCQAQELLDESTGYFDYKDFKTRLPQTADGGTVTWAIDSGSFAWNTNFDSVISVTTGSTTQDDAGIATRPLGPIVPNSGQKLWFEAAVSVASISAVQGLFVGVANLASLGTKKLISAASATKNSNTVGTSSGKQSFYGFWLHGDAPTNFDAVWANGITTALTPTTIAAPGTSAAGGGLVVSSVLTLPTQTAYPNPSNPLGFNNSQFNVTPPAGALVATTSGNVTVNGASLTPQQQYALGVTPSSATGASGFVKLGIRYDGTANYLYYYVNGVQVAKIIVNSNMDLVSDFGGIVDFMAIGTGTPVLNVGFVKTAAKVF